MSREEPWIQKPLDVLRRITILPNEADDFTARFNTLTRLLIVICVILAVVKWRYWYVILIVGLLVLLHAYLMHQDCVQDEKKLKTNAKNKIANEKMSQESASAFYTVQRIEDDSKGVSLRQLANAPTQPKTAETITMKPRIVKTNGRKTKPIMTPKAEPQLKIKSANGSKRTTAPTPKKREGQPDFMKIAFEELDDGQIADQDTKNMESLFL